MAADLRAMSLALFTAVLFIGSLSAGLPVPQDAPIGISPVDETPVQQPNDMMTQVLQQTQKVDIPPTSETPSDTPMMAAPMVETPLGDTSLVGTPLGETPSETAVVQQQEQLGSQQPAAADTARPDCPEMGEKHIVLCEVDDKKGDVFHMAALPKEAPSPPEVNETT